MISIVRRIVNFIVFVRAVNRIHRPEVLDDRQAAQDVHSYRNERQTDVTADAGLYQDCKCQTKLCGIMFANSWCQNSYAFPPVCLVV